MEWMHLLKLEAARHSYNIVNSLGHGDLYGKIMYTHDPTIDILENIEVDEKIRQFQLDEDNTVGKVLVPYFEQNTSMPIFAHAFKTRGYEPITLECHADLPHCFRKQQDRYDNARCSTCIYASNEVLDRFGLTGYSISEILDMVDSDEKYDVTNIKYYSSQINSEKEDIVDIEYRGIDISYYALSSTRGYLKKYNINLDDYDEKRIYVGFLNTAKMLVDVSNIIFDHFDVDAVIGGDVKYVYDGIIMAVADQHSIPAAGPAGGKRSGTVVVGFQSNREPLYGYVDKNVAENYLNKELTEEENDEIIEIMDKRKKGIDLGVNHISFADIDTKPPDFKENKTFGLFTNLIWDASLSADDVLYADPFEWIQDTITTISENDRNLVIKVHPAEAIHGTNESLYEWILDEFNPLPDNIKILEPTTDISPYQLMESIDVGIVYNSTAGLEMAYEGIPTIVAGETHYRDLGFTFDPDTKRDYRMLLKKEKHTMTDEMQRRAKRYAHLFLVKRHFDDPVYHHSSNDKLEIQHEDIKPGNETFDKVIKGIINGGPIFNT